MSYMVITCLICFQSNAQLDFNSAFLCKCFIILCGWINVFQRASDNLHKTNILSHMQFHNQYQLTLFAHLYGNRQYRTVMPKYKNEELFSKLAATPVSGV